jgi:Tol biopolymer transport system component
VVPRGFVWLVVGIGLSLLSFAPLAPGTRQSQAVAPLAEPEPVGGAILAPVGRQVGWLAFEAPRPRLLTSFAPPSYVADLDVSANGLAVAAVQSAFADQNTLGSDLLSVDLTSGATAVYLARADASESLGWPAWTAHGGWLLFQRDDQSSAPVAYAGQSAVRYPARIETIDASGGGRRVVVDEGRQPTASPDGSLVAFVRSSAQGTGLFARGLASDTGDERVLLPVGWFPDVAYPRFSPRGNRIAVAVAVPIAVSRPLLGVFFSPAVAHAHGLPWDVWTVGADGSDPRLLAELGADDPSLSWAPDGSQLFVYGGTGSFLVDAATGEATRYAYLTGYGATAWVP